MRKAMVVAGSLGLLCAGGAWANDGPDVIKDKALIGYWQFNDSTFKKDSGPWGNDIAVGFPSGMSGVASGTAGAGYDGSGYLHIAGGSSSDPIKINVDTLKAPAWNNRTSPYYTILARFKSSKSYASSSKTTTDDCMNDTSKWHLLAARYQVGGKTGSDYAYMFCCDPDLYWKGTPFWSNSNRPEDGSDSLATLPVSVSSGRVTIGGNIASGSYFYEGDLDDVVVVNRMMAKDEITRFFLTGETYVYAKNHVGFDFAKNWSSNEGSINFKPGDIPGQAYLVENGKTVTNSMSAAVSEFGGTGFTGSISLGRKSGESLFNRVGGTNLLDSTAGTFTQVGDGTTVTIGDLRVRRGTINFSGDNQTLRVRSLTVLPTSPCNVEKEGAVCMLDAGGVVSGGGCLRKQGAGTLIVSNFDAAPGAAPKFSINAGFLKIKQLDGYEGGTLLVDKDTAPMTFTGKATVKEDSTIAVKYTPKLTAAGTYPVLSIPNGYTADRFSVEAECESTVPGTEFVCRQEVDGNMLSLVVEVKIPDEDKGSSKPMVLFE